MIWILLTVYQLKHFVADYPLQGKFMLGKFKPFPYFIIPLLSHGLVHGLFTFLIAVYFKSIETAIWLGVFDMVVHSTVDWIKANPSIGGRFTALSKKEMFTLIDNEKFTGLEYERNKKLKSNTYFWWALGADQLAHHLTHYLIIWMILQN